AAEACAEVLPPGKAKIARLPLKDANDMLTAGRGAEVIDAIWGAKEFRPDGVVSIGDVRDQALKPVEVGAAWPWPELTEATFGRRPGEVYALGAGTGVGKTDVFTQIIAHDALVLKVKCGVIYLEQPVVETARRIAGKVVGKRFHVPDGSWSQDELRSALDTLTSSGNVFLYDHFGQMDWETVESRIRYMAVGLGCRHIFLDHLTALAAGAEDERKVLEDVMARIAGLAQELGLVFHFISHLATPEGKPHEEGGRVMIRHFKGSRAIGFWSHFMFGLERDQQEEDEDKRSITTLRILKDRYTGQGTGKVIYLRYDQENGMLSVCSPDFADETKEKENADEPF
ncbi:MAG: DNA primase, partial [Myxococcaceae bacterium]|nr:DNA primase [Myxococcaceae bacterium]